MDASSAAVGRQSPDVRIPTKQGRSDVRGRTRGSAVRGGTERALLTLKELAGYPEGVSLDTLAGAVGAPKSSVHRALAALVKSGLAVRPEPGRYALGTEFVRLAYAHHEARSEPRLVEPCLRELAETYGEAAHYAELEGRDVVYLAKVTPPRGNVNMTSTIGGRNPAYCTGVGKALLASRLAVAHDDASFLATLEPLEPRTAKTLSDPRRLAADLRATAQRGYALDDEENEVGINCIAFPLFLASPTVASGAISVAALRHRTTLATLEAEAQAIRAVIHRRLGAVTP
jgi:IclR family transcriptional regulator, acetate operon repressor